MLRLTSTNRNCCGRGDRTVTVYLNGANRLCIVIANTASLNHHFYPMYLKVGQTYNMEIVNDIKTKY